ncbi:hypothetical protein NA57DRAFT_57907 [Rhizodiscina lignyota]|uniref:Uncharacterized protein n=1 Tax=Rhizodiscina lignyota TaxID=1504668 RepID=A0A9P4M429_9PEZI|nr:hypothetical protein NA57DRAFT_57907 [Rhizodiscina lignyota]
MPCLFTPSYPKAPFASRQSRPSEHSISSSTTPLTPVLGPREANVSSTGTLVPKPNEPAGPTWSIDAIDVVEHQLECVEDKLDGIKDKIMIAMVRGEDIKRLEEQKLSWSAKQKRLRERLMQVIDEEETLKVREAEQRWEEEVRRVGDEMESVMSIYEGKAEEEERRALAAARAARMRAQWPWLEARAMESSAPNCVSCRSVGGGGIGIGR